MDALYRQSQADVVIVGGLTDRMLPIISLKVIYMGNSNDFIFFNHLKRLIKEDGCIWHDSGEGFLWTEKLRPSKDIVWFYYLHADEIKIIIGVNGFQKGAISLDEIHLMRLYRAIDGKGDTVTDITKGEWKSMMSYLYIETEQAIKMSKKA